MPAQPETSSIRTAEDPGLVSPSPASAVHRSPALPIMLACLAVVLLYARSLASPVSFYDDFQILAQSWTWERTREGLWIPQNEHAMPLGRLLTFGLECLAGRLPFVPFLTCLVGPLALLLALALVHIFVRRETGHSLYALLALVLFGVTTVYHQAIWWFAASFAVLALDTMLLGLLAAQRWRQTGRTVYLDLTVLACLLAPGWFAIGVLAGPLCCLYLLLNAETASPPRQQGRSLLARRAGSILHSRMSLLPLVGTALFLAISLPRTAQTILHLEHYGDKDAVQAFNPLIGLAYTARSIVDNLLLGAVGVSGIALPLKLTVPLLIGVIVVGAWWWRQASQRRLMLLGLGLIGSSYLLVYSARSTWLYVQMVEPAFSRYHLLPQLGLVLFFCGGLSGRAGRWFTLTDKDAITARQRRFVYALIGVLFLVHLPRSLICESPTWWSPFQGVRDQFVVLNRIEEVDALCQKHHISAAAARQALGTLEVPFSEGVLDGWEFLRGSDDPRPLRPDEIRRLLGVPPPNDPPRDEPTSRR